MARPRKQTYPLKTYLDKIKDGDIDNSADVQRNFVWKPEQINELMVTVLTDDYIPPIILGEEENTQLHIADGGQRSAALKLFRYGNYKITSSIEDSIIPYKKKNKDEKGNIVWEDTEFDIKNCTYEKLPDELKKKFDEYQLETVIHENCDRKRISKYIRVYNNHIAMNTNQKAFVYIENFAGYIRKILDRDFFVNHSSYTETEKTKGVTERIVIESVMCMFHLEEWKKQAKQIASYLNKNSSFEEFDKLNDNLKRLENIITDDIKDIFNSKNSFIWLTLFNHFTDLGIEDCRFADFLREFKKGLRNKSVDGKLFDTVDNDAGTKDKAIIIAKLHILETLMKEYLHIEEVKSIMPVNEEEFISEIVDLPIETVKEDISLYEETLTDLKNNTIKDGSKLLDVANHLSLLAMIAYSYKNDIDLDDWLEDYAKNNKTYFIDQSKNFCFMVKSLENYNKRKAVV